MQVITRRPGVRRYSAKRPSNRINGSNHHIPTNIRELDDHFSLQLAIPGFEKEQIAIEFKDGDQLIIKGSVGEIKEDGKFFQREFVPRSFEKVFTIGETIDKDQISATFEQGVLDIRLTKREEAKKAAPRTIEVF